MGGFLYLLPVEKSGRVCERFRRSGWGEGVCLSKPPLLSDETNGGGTFPLVLGGSSGRGRGGRSGLLKSLLELLEAFCSDGGLGGIGGCEPWSEWTKVGEGEDGSLPILLELR